MDHSILQLYAGVHNGYLSMSKRISAHGKRKRVDYVALANGIDVDSTIPQKKQAAAVKEKTNKLNVRFVAALSAVKSIPKKEYTLTNSLTEKRKDLQSTIQINNDLQSSNGYSNKNHTEATALPTQQSNHVSAKPSLLPDADSSLNSHSASCPITRSVVPNTYTSIISSPSAVVIPSSSSASITHVLPGANGKTYVIFNGKLHSLESSSQVVTQSIGNQTNSNFISTGINQSISSAITQATSLQISSKSAFVQQGTFRKIH